MKFGVQQWSHGAAGCSANAEALSSIISAVKNIWRLSAGKTINAFIRDQKLLSFPFCLVFRIPPSIRRQRRVPFYFLDVHRGVSFNSLGLFHIIKATRNRQQCLALHTTRRPLPASFSRFGFDPIWTMNRGRRKNEAPVGEMRKRGIKDGKKRRKQKDDTKQGEMRTRDERSRDRRKEGKKRGIELLRWITSSSGPLPSRRKDAIIQFASIPLPWICRGGFICCNVLQASSLKDRRTKTRPLSI